ncbi:cytochrome P450 6l1-like isoform X2 [Temnothorax nylanderi]|uniref:cytochrome P450 6l1-like isoform X2 n=1 Tax=Temnothorax nylanderi TaxID=102681 RepID=UPI003A868B55
MCEGKPGFETSAATAMFALYELAYHQDIQDKVREKIDETLAKHGNLIYDAANEMTYLHKVINETLRKYPPLPMLNRICTKEINLPTTNIYLPKGTLITIPVLGLYRDSSIYPDPDKFDPERFNADEIAKRHPYTFLPFGEGNESVLRKQSLCDYIVIKISKNRTVVKSIEILDKNRFNEFRIADQENRSRCSV